MIVEVKVECPSSLREIRASLGIGKEICDNQGTGAYLTLIKERDRYQIESH